MLPGKKFTPEEVLLILRRRFWLIVVPFAVASAVASVYARWLPDVYQAEAIVSVVAPRIPDAIAGRLQTTRLDERLPAIQNTIMSRTRLERIIEDLNLYADERRNGILEDIIEGMRSQMNVGAIRGDAFRIRFTGKEPRTVMRVADRLAQLFIDESSRARSQLVQGTDEFIEAELKNAHQRLVQKEQEVAAYRRRFGDQLPEQLQANLQAGSTVQSQIQALVAATDRNQERRIQLERRIQDEENLVDTVIGVAAAGQGSSTSQRLAAARDTLSRLELTFKSDHPEVQAVKRTIRDLQAQLEKEATEMPVSAGGTRGLSPAEAARQNRLAGLREQLDQLVRSMERDQTEIKRLQGISDIYRQRAEAAPTRSTEMIELTRDYNAVTATYNNLRTQKEASSLQANIERRQIGESFQLLDAARLPSRPISPNRPQITYMGMAIGFGLGVALVVLLEYRDSTFKTDDDLASVLGVPVLAVVPLMRSDAERRRELRLRLARGTILGTGVLACLAVVAYTFFY